MKEAEAFEKNEPNSENRALQDPHTPEGPRSADGVDEKIIEGLMRTRGFTREQAMKLINEQMKDRIKKDTDA